jgi:L-amino acid N-acyltransferase YncA
MNVRPAGSDDAVQIAYIYNHYIATSHATFETEPLDGADVQKLMIAAAGGGSPFLICEVDGDVAGFAYGKPFRQRPAYSHTVEVSVYVKPGGDGLGVGSELYRALLAEIALRDYHAVIAGISLPNDSSIALHEKFGFEKVAHFREVGRKFDRWIDVGYWEKILLPGDR